MTDTQTENAPKAGSRFKRWLGRFALAGVSLLIALPLAELVVRITVPRIGTHNKLLCEHDQLLGWRKIPHGTGRMMTSEYDVAEKLNSKGLRGPEYGYEKGPAYRVLVLGDSYVEGYTVTSDNLVTTILEQKLNNGHKKTFQVINGGTGGYSTDQELLFFTSEGKKYAPDLTILMFYANDVFYNTQHRYRRGQKPLFVFDEHGKLKLTNVPVPPPAPEVAPAGIKGFLREHSELYLLTRETVKRRRNLYELLTKIGVMAPPSSPNGFNGTVAGDNIPPEYQVYLRETPPVAVEYAWKMTGALLHKLAEETAAVNSRLLVFYVPPLPAIDADSRAVFARQYSDAVDPDQPVRVLERICGEHKIDFMDPAPALIAETTRLAASRGSLYFKLDGHWNAGGHRLVADLLARKILEYYASD